MDGWKLWILLWWKEPPKESALQNQDGIRMEDICQSKSQQRGGKVVTKSHPQPRSSTQLRAPRRGKLHFSHGVHWAASTTHGAGPRSGIVGQHKLESTLFCVVMFWFWVLVFLVSFKRKKEHEVEWVGKWRGIWEEVEKGKSWTKYIACNYQGINKDIEQKKMKFVSNNDCEGQREKQEGMGRASYQKVKGFHVVKVTM